MRPFADNAYFVPNPLQAQAAARLRQAVTFPGGIALLSGGPGVGKSAFLRHALARVDSEVQLLPVDLRSADPAELHDAVLHGLGGAAASGLPLPVQLRNALAAQRTSGRQLILSLDVPGINVDLARRLLRFLHLADEQGAPVSLVLQGPHALHPLLDLAGLIQLRQRLSFRLKLRPMTLLETAAYVRHCLAEGGANPDELLATNAPASVYLYVAGVPRLINTLMDATLGEARVRQQGRVDAELVRQVAEQLGWKPLGGHAVPEPAAKPGRTADRSANAPAAVPPAAPSMARPSPSAEASPARRAPPVPMDEVDTGATGILRLEDLDERFAETLFSEDSGHFKALIDAGKTD
jgi:type II secretory pathway predicted ATPase ExeA